MSASIFHGSKAQARRLIADHRGYLAAVIRAKLDTRLASRLDVSDVIQDVQLQAVRRLDDFLSQQVLTLKQWLRILACDRIGMECRRHLIAEKRTILRERRSTEMSKGDFVARITSDVQTPSALIAGKQDAERVHVALAKLSPSDRRIIILQVFEQRSGKEVAAILEIAPAAARKRFCRALLRLKETISSVE